MKFWDWSGKKVIGWILLISGIRIIMIDAMRSADGYSDEFSWAIWLGGIALIFGGVMLFRSKKKDKPQEQ